MASWLMSLALYVGRVACAFGKGGFCHWGGGSLLSLFNSPSKSRCSGSLACIPRHRIRCKKEFRGTGYGTGLLAGYGTGTWELDYYSLDLDGIRNRDRA